jgi:hypothetical protein
MNSLMTDTYPLFRKYQDLRPQLMGILSDGDLGFRPAEGNPTLGELCREMGAVEVGYIDSFRTFRFDLAAVATAGEGKASVGELGRWFTDLDDELEAVIEGLAEDDLAHKTVDRGGWEVSPRVQLDIYREALLIFCGKVSVYLRAKGKTLPEQWEDWIG